MTAVAEHDPMPWTEDEFFALGETSQRIELFDGSLYVSPAPSLRHQTISMKLAIALTPAVEAAGYDLYEAINVRLRPGRIPIPDLVIAEDVDPDGTVLDADHVLLVCEIMSPSNVVADQVTKMHYYAVAGIPWYLLIDPEGPTMVLHQLQEDIYVEHDRAAPGRPMRFPEPIDIEVDPAGLVRARA